MNRMCLLFGGGWLAVVWLLTGCGSINPNVVKTRGVYTTLAVTNDGSMYLPGQAYQSYQNFDAGQSPAAVVTGYGLYDGNQLLPQSFVLEVSEQVSGKILYTLDGVDYYDKATVLPLAIRKDGAYRLKLYINNSVYDTWDFTVRREITMAGTNAPTRAYAKGNFSASLTGVPDASGFDVYSDTLLQSILDSLTRTTKDMDLSQFAQVYPGQVAIQFQEDRQGNVSAPFIIKNTLNEPLGKLFMQALQAGSPYKPWPATLQTWPPHWLTCTFYFD